MPSIPAGVLIISRSAFFDVMRHACGISLGKKTIPPSDSFHVLVVAPEQCGPFDQHEDLILTRVFVLPGRSTFVDIERPIINLPSVALPSSQIANVPPSSHSNCCCCSGCARYAMLMSYP